MSQPDNLKIITHDLGVDVESVRIIPIGDMHIGSHFNENAYWKQVEEILNDPNCYAVINGDVTEMVTKNSVGNVYESLRPKQQKELAIKFLKPLAENGRILAYLDGNHEHRASKETDEYVGEYICNMLGIPSVYDPDGIYLFLTVGYSARYGRSTRIVYTAYMLHGWTGARRIGGKANTLEDMAKGVIADIYIMNHTHQQLAFPDNMVVPDTRTRKLKFMSQKYVMSGPFLDWAGYAIRRGYSPSYIGAPLIYLSGSEKRVEVTVR